MGWRGDKAISQRVRDIRIHCLLVTCFQAIRLFDINAQILSHVADIECVVVKL